MNNNVSRPEWMDDELVKDIPDKKLEFLSTMFMSANGKSQKQMMMSLLPMLKKAREANLTFTQAEMAQAVAAIKKYSSKEELSQIDNILNKAKKDAPN